MPQTKCALCENIRNLRESHIIPSFVFRWIKGTSATGYFRFNENPNLRVQDGKKVYLLCDDCEGLFNKYETQFANEIFYPYVDKELTADGVASGTIKYFEYQSWLLKFVISVQWRLLVTWKIIPESVTERQFKLLESFRHIWKKFLYDKRKDTGACETHIILLQNLSSGKGYLPDNINDRINSYLLRAVDATIAIGRNLLGIYTKIGPICLFTSFFPEKLKDLPNSRIRMNGQLSTIQRIANPQLTNFLFIDRPNEVIPRMKYSEKQKVVVLKTLEKNFSRAEQSHTIRVLESDWSLENSKKQK